MVYSLLLLYLSRLGNAIVDGAYEIQQIRGNQAIASLIFPNLKLTAEQVLRTGG
jgi:Uma2 family endonuclease